MTTSTKAANTRSLRDEREARRARYEAGIAAEEIAARAYRRRGAKLRENRWRGKGAEIDLIFADGDEIVFVEVKQSRTTERAAANLRPAQMSRLMRGAEEYLGGCPNGLMTECRFDVALVDRRGNLEIIPNALQAA